jgi:threonine/homoserine/homoserine lactone efflux protein
VVVKLAGAAYWSGWASALAGRGDVIEVRTDAAPVRRSVAGGVLGGFLICLGNPKVILFYCSFLPAFVDMTRLTPGDLLSIVGVVLVTLAASAATYALAAARAIKLLRSRRALRLANRAGARSSAAASRWPR